LKLEDATFSWNNMEESIQSENAEPQAAETDNQRTKLLENGDKNIVEDFKDKDLLLQRLSMQIHPVSVQPV